MVNGGHQTQASRQTEPAHYRLDVWQQSMKLVKVVYQLTAEFPAEEKFGLTAQMRRSAISVPSNIAEGAARGSRGDFVRFLQITRASLMELDTQLWLARDLGFIENARETRQQLVSILKLLNGLMQSRA